MQPKWLQIVLKVEPLRDRGPDQSNIREESRQDEQNIVEVPNVHHVGFLMNSCLLCPDLMSSWLLAWEMQNGDVLCEIALVVRTTECVKMITRHMRMPGAFFRINVRHYMKLRSKT